MAPLSFDPNLWADRVQVARDAAAELGELGRALDVVLQANYFGRGCVEGDELYSKLREVVSHGSATIHRCAADASDLANLTRVGADTLSEVDAAAAAEVGSATK